MVARNDTQLQALAEVNAAIDDFKTQRAMGLLRSYVVEKSIRCDFAALLGSRPIFRGTHQLFPNASTSHLLAHKPALNKPYRPGSIASIRMRAQTNFEEARQIIIRLDRKQQHAGQCSAHPALNLRLDFPAMFLNGSIGPQQGTHLREFGFITLPRSPNRSRRHGHDFNQPFFNAQSCVSQIRHST